MARSLLVVGLLVVCNCGRDRIAVPGEAHATTPADMLAAAQVPVAVHLPLEPVDATGAGSAGAVALARLGQRTLALLADADDDAIVTFDVDARQAIASTPLGARPSAVLVTPTGRIVALGADDARAHVLIMTQVDRPLVAERSVAVPEEPVSATLAPGGDAVLVASRWGHALAVVPLTGVDAPVVIDLPRDPAVVASSDGHRAFVVHAAGSRASVVDLDTRSVRPVSLDRQIPKPMGEDGWMKKVSVADFAEQNVFLGGIDESQGAVAAKPMARHLQRRDASDTITVHADQAFAAVRVKDGVVAPSLPSIPGPTTGAWAMAVGAPR